MRLDTKYIQISNGQISNGQISNGIILPYIEQGGLNKHTVIFLHGVTDSHRSFEVLFQHLPENMHAIALTQRGHGDAPRLASGYDPSDFSADLLGFLDAKGIQHAIIAGHSLGSFVAQRFAIDHPERVAGLILIGSFPTCSNKPGIIEFVRDEIEKLTDPISLEFAMRFQTSTVEMPIPQGMLEMAAAESMKVPARIWKEACRSMIKCDHTEELVKIKAKTLLIWGERDAYFSAADQRVLLEKIPDSTLAAYKGVGHAPHWETPARVALDITNFLEKLAETGILTKGSI